MYRGLTPVLYGGQTPVEDSSLRAASRLRSCVGQMARKLRVTEANHVYHVLNRAAKHAILFGTAQECFKFEQLLEEAIRRFQMRTLAYCLMGTHWHFLLWPKNDREISQFIKWLSGTHALRWNTDHDGVGNGAVYQSRFKSVLIENERHLLTAWRYIERNALAAQLVVRAEDWRWSSLWRRTRGPFPHCLCEGPVSLPDNWVEFVNRSNVIVGEDYVTAKPPRRRSTKPCRQG